MSYPITMINTRGRVVQVDNDRIDTYKNMGFRYIQNPTETYYPQYDQSLESSSVPKVDIMSEPLGDVLKVEIL